MYFNTVSIASYLLFTPLGPDHRGCAHAGSALTNTVRECLSFGGIRFSVIPCGLFFTSCAVPSAPITLVLRKRRVNEQDSSASRSSYSFQSRMAPVPLDATASR